ncbi:DUF3953 domain-containing protein [Salipaludibacillus daqingensis]|uniref:DUF3953 domain-containing protein n=1 Tax=Salipaludibacillus daqingensis TaxID=3041001 RepID=UPI0024731750|nr:DUF3953 domain-containing protein [Salipaludibacillus daqingensis]
MILVRIGLAIILIFLSSYIIITKNFDLMTPMMLLLGMLMLFNGLVERQKDKKSFWGYLFITISLFLLVFSIQGLIL